MIKTKWLEVELPINLVELYDLLRSSPYSDRVTRGYDILEILDDKISGKYIEKNVQVETVVTPFGSSNEIEITRYIVVDFHFVHLYFNKYLLIIDTPPRSLRSFVDSLYDLIGYGFFVSLLSFDLKLMLTILKESLKPVTIKLKKVKVSGIQISEKTSATIVLNSRGDPISDLDNLFGLSKITLERINGSLIRAGKSSEIEISKNGSFIYSESFHEELLPIVKIYKASGIAESSSTK